MAHCNTILFQIVNTPPAKAHVVTHKFNWTQAD